MVLTTVAASGESSEPAPKFGFTCGDTIDFGKFDSGCKREGELYFVNSGTAPLIVSGVFTDCGCTAASFPKGEIAPGDTASIVVRFNPEGRSPGNFKKAVRIMTNSGEGIVIGYVKGVIKRKYVE